MLINNIYELNLGKLNKWLKKYYFHLSVFNIFLVSLFFLRSAGYFQPFFQITIQLIVFISLVISIPLLGIRSKALFLITLFFWLFSAFLRIIKIEVWAERTSEYAYFSLVLASLVFFIESLRWRRLGRQDFSS